MDLVNQIVDERRRIEQEDEELRQAAEKAKRERLQQQQEQNSKSKRTASTNSARGGGGKMLLPPQRPQKPRETTTGGTSSRIASSAARRAEASKNSATARQSLRQSRREAKKEEDAAAVANASGALLDSIVPQQLVESAADFVLSVAPRIFAFHTRHISSFRHPFFTMLCHEDPEGSPDDAFGAVVSEQDGGATSTAAAANRRSGNRQPGKPLHRGGTAMVTTAHVSAVENALKAKRRPWQTIGEYLVDRFSDLSSSYPIEMERWKQASYMLDAVLLEDDLSHRRRDILESQPVVRALEACWTSWGGTTTEGIDFDTYRLHHVRLYQALLGVEALDQSLAMQVDRCIEKDWIVDREVVGPRSPSRLLGNSMRRSVSPGGASSNNNNDGDTEISSPRRGSLARQGSTRSLSRGRENSEEKDAAAVAGASSSSLVATGIAQVQYEVPFRRFCIAMLELADNWTRARVGDVFSQVFAKFLMKIVWCEPSRDTVPAAGAGAAVPASFAHIQKLERERARQQKMFEEQLQEQQQEEGGGGAAVMAKDPEGVNNNTRPNSQEIPQRPGTGEFISNDNVGGGEFDGSASMVDDEWSRICEGLKRRAFLHRGGPIVRMVPPTCPGMPASYVALPGTRTLASVKEP